MVLLVTRRPAGMLLSSLVEHGRLWRAVRRDVRRGYPASSDLVVSGANEADESDDSSSRQIAAGRLADGVRQVGVR